MRSAAPFVFKPPPCCFYGLYERVFGVLAGGNSGGRVENSRGGISAAGHILYLANGRSFFQSPSFTRFLSIL